MGKQETNEVSIECVEVKDMKPTFLTRKFTHTLASSVSSIALVITLGLTVASAQTADEVIEEDEVIVTVERRAQSLQSYAGTAEVISGADIKALGLQNITDLDGHIPGLSIANNQGNIEVFIRGVGSDLNTELGDPAAATHLNGVYVPRPAGFGAAFFDIERVEVNIGPQGTLRGRNATAGSVNIIPWQPGLGVFDASLEAHYGNYNEFGMEAVINVPIGDKQAFRAAAFFLNHDSYLTNVSPTSQDLGLDVPVAQSEGVGVAEAADDFGARLSYLAEITPALTVTLTADYLEQKGTGYTGVNYANPLGNGVLPEDIPEPRRVFGRAFTPQEDTKHYGFKWQIDYETDWFDIEYIGSYRDLVYDYEFVTPAAPEYEGALATLGDLDFDNFSRVRFITDSQSFVHEVRLFDERDFISWNLGGFYFKEDQRTFLGTTGDRNPFFTGVEFNQTTTTNSYSFYGDATLYDADNNFRLTLGLRYTDDDKERFGVNARYVFIIGGAGFGCCFGTGHGTEGFEFSGLGRTIGVTSDPDADGDGALNDDEVLAFFFDGVSQFGARDGLDDIYANGITPGDAPVENHPLCAGLLFTGACPSTLTDPDFDDHLDGRIAFAVLGGNTIALQNGLLDNSFVDWRVRLEYDVSDDNLVYLLVSTGNKSGGFNDNIAGTEGLRTFSPLASAPAFFDADTVAPTYGPESLRLHEIGSKNSFDIGNIRVNLNASAFYYDYENLQLTTLLSSAQALSANGIALTPDQLEQLGGNVVSLTFNAGAAEIYGGQLEAKLSFPDDLTFDSTLLWLPTARVVNAREIQDGRYQADVDAVNAVSRSIDGHRLARTPEWQWNASISKAFALESGKIDGIVAIGYRSSQHLTIFNGVDYNLEDDVALRLNDTVDGYFTMDLGMGYTYGDDRFRVEGYVNNVTDQQPEQAIIITQFDNTRFFARPRTYGVRVRVKY